MFNSFLTSHINIGFGFSHYAQEILTRTTLPISLFKLIYQKQESRKKYYKQWTNAKINVP